MDLGLPSGTLWLDRPLGAESVGAPGLMYQWGSLIGYQSTSEYNFSLANYEEQGFNLITGDLTTNHDAAAAYYGGIARMPSRSQLQELINNTSVSVSGNSYRLVSNINGNLISIYGMGEFIDQVIQNPSDLYIWSKNIVDESLARALHIKSSGETALNDIPRFRGLLILPVKSS